MDLDLKELAATLAIGAFFIFGFEFITLNFLGRTISSKIITRVDIDTNQYVVGAFAIALCFVFGMVIEDVSNKFVDEDSWLTYRGILESDDEIKTNIFFGEFYPLIVDESSFAFVAARHGLLGKHGGTDGKIIETHILRASSGTTFTVPDSEVIPKQTNLTRAAKRFYYNAKNIVYQDNSYYDELKRIQMRIDFSRSLVVVALFLILVITVITLFKAGLLSAIEIIILYVRKFMPRSPSLCTRVFKILRRLVNNRDYLFTSPRIQWARLLAASLILCSTLILAIFAYSSEEAEFDKRAYGYYLSTKIDGEKNSYLDKH